MFVALLIIQTLIGLAIIGLVLLQQGKGADMGAAFGAGASGTVFGARGSGSFFSRATAVLAALFFANGVLMSSPLVQHPGQAGASVTEKVEVPVKPAELPDLPPAPAQGGDDLPAAAQPAPADESGSDLPPAPSGQGGDNPPG